MSIAYTRRVTAVLAVLAVLAATAAQGQSAAQGSDRYTELARRVVQTSAAVKPGNVVYITGGKHTIPLMEALGAEVMRAGAAAFLTFDSERLLTAFFRE